MSELVKAMEKYLAMGEKLGLKGPELKQFLDEQNKAETQRVNVECEERARQREFEIRQRELDTVRQEKEAEERERVRQLERAKMDHDLELRRLELGIGGDAAADATNLAAAANTTVGSRSFIPKLPPFEESRDIMDAYLNRFERFAEAQRWDRNIWAQYLSALLKGKALEVYGRIPVNQAGDYAALKEGLLKRLQLTEEGFRNKFAESKADTGESPTQFLARLENYFTRWMDLSGTSKTYEGARDLLISE